MKHPKFCNDCKKHMEVRKTECRNCRGRDKL